MNEPLENRLKPAPSARGAGGSPCPAYTGQLGSRAATGQLGDFACKLLISLNMQAGQLAGQQQGRPSAPCPPFFRRWARWGTRGGVAA